MRKTVADDPKTGKITFIQSHRPPLADGLYEITVAQRVQNTDPSAPPKAQFDETYTNSRRFQVSGERFTLNATEITSTFPPAGSMGEYTNVLPHIIFDRQTLPWERTVGDADRSTWLALLLFDQNDPVPEVRTVMVGDLQREPFPRREGGPDEASLLPSTAVSYPGLTLNYGEVMWDPCNIVDIPIDLFQQIVPGAVDMPWISHSRTVTPKDGGPPVESSVLVANRLPDPNTQCTVHLVSLENMLSYLPSGDRYVPADILLPDGSKAATVRLVSLASWSYRSVDPENTFAGLLMNLDKSNGLRVLAIQNDATGGTDADAYVANTLDMGFAPVNHHTRQGSKTVSWYRGPFAPFPVPPTIFVPVPGGPSETAPIQTADEAVRYDPETGMMDVSYASAWQIGRLLALQDTGFSLALARWKRDNTQLVFEAFERGILEQQLGPALSLTSQPTAARDGLNMHRAVADLIRGPLRDHLTRSGKGDTQ